MWTMTHQRKRPSVCPHGDLLRMSADLRGQVCAIGEPGMFQYCVHTRPVRWSQLKQTLQKKT